MLYLYLIDVDIEIEIGRIRDRNRDRRQILVSGHWIVARLQAASSYFAWRTMRRSESEHYAHLRARGRYVTSGRLIQTLGL
jgi:tRNA splicing endonuclease